MGYGAGRRLTANRDFVAGTIFTALRDLSQMRLETPVDGIGRRKFFDAPPSYATLAYAPTSEPAASASVKKIASSLRNGPGYRNARWLTARKVVCRSQPSGWDRYAYK